MQPRCWFGVLSAFAVLGANVLGQSDPAYTSGRPSLCDMPRPAIAVVPSVHADSGVKETGLRVERIQTWVADAKGVQRGELTLCSEYGRIEIQDADDDRVQLRVRSSTFGEGARQALTDTPVETHVSFESGVLRVAVWHTTQGFTKGVNPNDVSIRVLVPRSARYLIRARAQHGGVSVRGLTISGGRLEGLVGAKMRGIPGYQGGHELWNVLLAGDLEVVLSGGVRGSGSIHGSVAVLANSALHVEADDAPVRLAVIPDTEVGIRATTRSTSGAMRVLFERPGVIPAPGSAAGQSPPQIGGELSRESDGFADTRTQLTITVKTTSGAIDVVSAM